MNNTLVQPAQTLKRDPDGFLQRSVQDLFSLKQRTVVITGGARGIGLAFAFAVAESGGNVAVLDVSAEPHAHFHELAKRFPEQQFKTYKCVEVLLLGFSLLTVRCCHRTDVTDYAVLKKTFASVVEDFERIDGL